MINPKTSPIRISLIITPIYGKNSDGITGVLTVINGKTTTVILTANPSLTSAGTPLAPKTGAIITIPAHREKISKSKERFHCSISASPKFPPPLTITASADVLCA
jgi:hypothetical protein